MPGASTLSAVMTFSGRAFSCGDIGWIAKGQLNATLEAAIFATKVGSVSNVIAVPNDGIYLVKVLAEETRTPAGQQLDTIKSSAFSNWYTQKKDAATITRDPTLASSSSSG